jgi:hypothetical protein
MAKKLLLTLALSTWLSGCKDTSPTLAGGKSASHWVAAYRSPDAQVRRTAVAKLPGHPGGLLPQGSHRSGRARLTHPARQTTGSRRTEAPTPEASAGQSA